MSDGNTNFKNETLRLVCRGLRIPNHLKLSYSPWSNGTVERLGKEILKMLHATVSELQMNQNEWPDLIPIVKSASKNVPSPQRCTVAPITVLTEKPPRIPL